MATIMGYPRNPSNESLWGDWESKGESAGKTTPFDPAAYSNVYRSVMGGGGYGMARPEIEALFEQTKGAMMAPYLEQIRAQAAEQGRRPGVGGAMPGVDLQATMGAEAQHFALPKMSSILQAASEEAGRKAGLAGQMISPTSTSSSSSMSKGRTPPPDSGGIGGAIGNQPIWPTDWSGGGTGGFGNAGGSVGGSKAAPSSPGSLNNPLSPRDILAQSGTGYGAGQGEADYQRGVDWYPEQSNIYNAATGPTYSSPTTPQPQELAGAEGPGYWERGVSGRKRLSEEEGKARMSGGGGSDYWYGV